MKKMNTRLLQVLCTLVICTGFTGCGKNTVKDTPGSDGKSADVFDSAVTSCEKTEDNIRVDATVSIPEGAKSGSVTCAVGEPLALADQMDKIKELFFSDKSSLQMEEHEMDSRFFVLESSDSDPDWKVLAYNDTENLLINSNAYNYYQNCIVTESYAEDFNADQYQISDQLDFMSRDEAADQVRNVLGELGIHLGEVVKVYAMDHERMQQLEDVTDIAGNYDESKKKAAWSADDDTYYFYFHQEYHGLPVMHNLYSGQGFEDGEAATVMYNASGMISASITGCYQWSDDKNVSVISIDQALDTVVRNYGGIVNTSYEIGKISLMMDIIPKADHKAVLRPVWVFDTEVSGEDYRYHSNIIIDAESGEELTV